MKFMMKWLFICSLFVMGFGVSGGIGSAETLPPSPTITLTEASGDGVFQIYEDVTLTATFDLTSEPEFTNGTLSLKIPLCFWHVMDFDVQVTGTGTGPFVGLSFDGLSYNSYFEQVYVAEEGHTFLEVSVSDLTNGSPATPGTVEISIDMQYVSGFDRYNCGYYDSGEIIEALADCANGLICETARLELVSPEIPPSVMTYTYEDGNESGTFDAGDIVRYEVEIDEYLGYTEANPISGSGYWRYELGFSVGPCQEIVHAYADLMEGAGTHWITSEGYGTRSWWASYYVTFHERTHSAEPMTTQRPIPLVVKTKLLDCAESPFTQSGLVCGTQCGGSNSVTFEFDPSLNVIVPSPEIAIADANGDDTITVNEDITMTVSYDMTSNRSTTNGELEVTIPECIVEASDPMNVTIAGTGDFASLSTDDLLTRTYTSFDGFFYTFFEKYYLTNLMSVATGQPSTIDFIFDMNYAYAFDCLADDYIMPRVEAECGLGISCDSASILMDVPLVVPSAVAVGMVESTTTPPPMPTLLLVVFALMFLLTGQTLRHRGRDI